MARAVSVLPSANGLLRAAEVGDGAEGSSGEGRRRGRRLEDRGSADNLVPAGRRRNDQERGVTSDAPDREPVETHSITHSMGQYEEKAPQQKSLQGLIFTQSGRRDLNPRPPEPHSGALPDCATSRYPTPETPPREQSTDARRTDAPRLSARLTRIDCSSKPTLQPLRVRGLIPQLQGLNLLRA